MAKLSASLSEARDPLLHPLGFRASSSSKDLCLTQESPASNRSIWAEVRTQCSLAFPMIYVSVAQYSIQIVSLVFSGHLDEFSLSSASLATSFASVTGNSLLLGMGSTLETLCGQAYGARNYPLLWLFLQRAEIVLNVTSIPIAILWVNMEKILLWLGQDPLISQKATEYLYYLVPSLFAYASLQPLVKYLQTQSIIVPMAILSSITFFIHVHLCWLIVFKFKLGNPGTALANSISSWLNIALLLVYIFTSPKCAKTRGSFSWKAFHDMNSFIKLAIPSALMICLEYWSYELVVILSGLLPDPQLETSILSICLTTATLVFMIPYGLSAAVSTRISNELGAGRPQAARLASYVSLSLAALEVVLVSGVLLLARNVLGMAYSSDPVIIHNVSGMVPILAGSTFLDGIQGVLSGVARGCGLQKLGVFINLGAYYVVGLPISIILGFALHMEGTGLWMGIFCGVLIQAMLLLFLTICANWEKQAKEAKLRISRSAALE